MDHKTSDRCPGEKLAFDKVIHYTLDGITGLALRCKKIE
jgi:hypothetical protein